MTLDEPNLQRVSGPRRPLATLGGERIFSSGEQFLARALRITMDCLAFNPIQLTRDEARTEVVP